ncbi:MAG: response regulator [Lachnospiraceae bacterium]
MKKILLVGEVNQTVSSVNNHLSSIFQTQICTDSLDMLQGMTRIYQPDMVVICLVGIVEIDKGILDYYAREKSQIPVLLLGTSEECSACQEYTQGEQFDYLVRPITSSALIKKCQEILKVRVPETYFYSPQRTKKERKTVLAVDDSGILLRNVKSLLEKDYEVKVATSGQMALKQARKEAPDIILLDYEMPQWDGKRTLEEIRADEELKDIPVVFLTSIADKGDIIAILGLKPAGYILKPFNRDRLLDTIGKVLSGII